MWIVAGLGNPGKKYSRTRHNIGFMVIEEIACRHRIYLKDRETYRIGKGIIEGHSILLIEPLLYMNMSGLVIKNIIRKFNIPSQNLLVIHDDLDMEIGRLKIKRTGSSGGHKGVESIIQSIDSKDFVRLKIGISRETGISSEDYVLSRFKRNEIPTVKDTIQNAADAISSIVSEGLEKTMNIYNKPK
jgi:PTH1 family peptidyl-tRNA hydrolase